MTHPTIKLRECPCCGVQGNVQSDVLPQNEGWWHVLCHQRCGVMVRVFTKFQQQAIDTWNTRHTDKLLEMAAEGLRKIANPIYLNLKPTLTDIDNVRAIRDGLNSRIELAEKTLLTLQQHLGVK